jgi:hypothetical protein
MAIDVQELPAPGPVWTGLSRLFTRDGERMVVSIWEESCGFLPVGGMPEDGNVRIAPVVEGYFEAAGDATGFVDEALLEQGFEPEGTWSGAELGKKTPKAKKELVPAEQPLSRENERWVAEIVHALTGPIIVYSEEWGSTLPDWIKRDMALERMLKLMKDKEPGMATDLEAVAYLYSASFLAPMQRDWTDIYLYAASKELKKRGKEIPAEAPKKLNPDAEREYKTFKRWLHDRYEKLISQARKERAAAEYPAIRMAS